MTTLNRKKIPYYFLLFLLTTGAILILGLMSFGGMYAIVPIIPVAIASLVLSVVYEGEIYLQNIKGALKKLFKPFQIENQLAKKFLLDNFPKDINDRDCPEFFRDYTKTLKLLHNYEHKRLSEKDAKTKFYLEKRLKDMEKWFAAILFNKEELIGYDSKNIKAMRAWLARPELVQACQQIENKVKQRKTISIVTKVFSGLTAIFMTAGSTYLLAEAFAAIPILAGISVAAWPAIIVPMAIIAGTAYGLLTYNAITDMVHNETIQKWFRSLKKEFQDGVTVKGVFLSVTTALLVALAVGLTICTAGTWWTIVKEARPIFNWMKKIPAFIMGVINPVITGASSLIFNMENTFESLNLIKKIPQILATSWKSFVRGLKELPEKENLWQRLNPFRIILKLTITPLRILLFLGHLISIGVTSDRLPGFSQVMSAIFGIISEGFEDLHYFFDEDHEHEEHEHTDEHEHGHKHDETKHLQGLLEERLDSGHGHSHDLDLPTRILKFIFAPIYLLSAAYDHLTSKQNANDPNKKVYSFKEAFNKHWSGDVEKPQISNKDELKISKDWQYEHTLFCINKFKVKNANLSAEDKQILDEIAKKASSASGTSSVSNVITSSSETSENNEASSTVSNTASIESSTASSAGSEANNDVDDNELVSDIQTQEELTDIIYQAQHAEVTSRYCNGFFKSDTQIFIKEKLPRVLNDDEYNELENKNTRILGA